MRKNVSILLCLAFLCCLAVQGKTQSVNGASDLRTLQQQFVDLKFGMFIHFNIPTFMSDDWADPDASPAIFNPVKLDCNQWAEAAKAAKMRYGCLTTNITAVFVYGIRKRPVIMS